MNRHLFFFAAKSQNMPVLLLSALPLIAVSIMFFLSGTHEMMAQPATISSFTPTSGPPGTIVTIQMTQGATNQLVAVSMASINGVACNVLNYGGIQGSMYQVQITVATSATTGLIALTVYNSVSRAYETVRSSANFTVTAQTTPTITDFTPKSGSVGTVITITGANLTRATGVRLGGFPMAFTINANGTISATVPSNYAFNSGAVNVDIPGVPNGTLQFSAVFTVTRPPTITSFAPTSGSPGTLVTITGTDFTGTSLVAIGGRVSAFTVVSPTTITVTIPSGIPTGNTPIVVITPSGQVTSTMMLTVMTSVRDASPEAFKARIFPQPASSQTTLEYTLAEVADVRAEVVNLLGMNVSSYSLGKQQSGSQRFGINTDGLSAGAYFVRLSIGTTTAMLPMQVVR